MENTMFYRLNEEKNAVLFNTNGDVVTQLEGCWPLGSELGGAYEHPEGIILSVEDAKKLGILEEG